MTDNEIIKALECCAKWESDKSCEDCPANTYGFGCANIMAKHSLDLINRQKAEIEELKQLTGIMQNRKWCRKFIDEVYQKEEGNELSYPDYDEIYKRYFFQRAEIERLQKEQHRFADIGKMYSEVKSEAIKEFAELIKQSTTDKSIDDLVEEMADD